MNALQRFVDRYAGWALPLLVLILPFAHTVALRHLLTLVLLLSGAAYCALRRPRGWPLALPVLAWAGWSLASASWSVQPLETLREWWGTVLPSGLAFYTAYHLSATAVVRQRMFVALALSLGALLLMSLFGFDWLQPDLLAPGWLYPYPGVGLASSVAVLMLPLCGLATFATGRRLLGWLGIAACVIVGAATLNRMFWPVALLTLAALLWPGLKLHGVRLWLVCIVLLVGVLLAMAWANQLRQDIAQQGNVWDAAIYSLQQLMLLDPRPQLWARWLPHLQHAPWLGLGYGQAIPGDFLRAQGLADAVLQDRFYGAHAHNVLFNAVLQTGLIGAALLIWLFAALWRAFWRRRREHPAIAAVGMALLVALLTKNLTDDFFRGGLATYFCLWAGHLLARAREPEHEHPADPPRQHR